MAISKKSSNAVFSSKDIKILTQAVSMFPNLEIACYATSIAYRQLKFPLKSYKDVKPLFDIKKIPDRIKKRGIRFSHFRKFFPREFFPIEDPQDFLGKALAALTWGDNIHYHENLIKNPVRYIQTPYHVKFSQEVK